ncbi:SAM-dependent methyltransferase [Rhodoferax lacus]|uniref:SAM-dependent methyltransferase n=1 Tax=Rhodoferax lacus TaxID=2184758 RepID=A0A3E1RBG2_9BURK|nr:class I SAM-dependent methyltransferase [Rhodoferax lacus]RFO96392.1 SAM-dependent methyltransferase [Rhodoferax lacus]
MTSTNSTPFTDPAQTWNQRFSKDGYVFGTEPNEWLRRQASFWKTGAKILCVADGEGRNSVWLAKQGHQVEAFDISDVGVAKALRLAQESQVSVDYKVASCDDFAWQQNQYDGVVAIFVQFADPELRARLFENMVLSLRPGGSILLLGYTPKQLEYGTGGPSVLSHLYTPAMLREALGALDIQVLEEYETELTEGEGHKGRSAVIGIVAMRSAAAR